MTSYVPRRAEHDVLEHVESVRSDGRSRVLLLYGEGGVGKTQLVRALADRHPDVGGPTRWLPPIDVDDSRYWLVANLEEFVVQQLDPHEEGFRRYRQAATSAQRYIGPHVGAETVLDHFSRLRREFVADYRSYVESGESIVVITLDTVETIRRMDLLLTIIQAMRVLPRTLFVLAGRPPAGSDEHDAIRQSLRQPTDAIGPETVTLGGFTGDEAFVFLDSGPARHMLNDAERSRLVRLTAGSPLWLELAVEYLTKVDRPAELTSGDLPDLDQPSAASAVEREVIRETFKRTLVSRFHSLDYWSEAMRRLAIMRHSIDQQVWTALTAEVERPPELADPEAAWQALLDQPWVRPRANRSLVTLHDAMAEALAQRVLPLHDQNGSWSRALWQRAAELYERRAGEPDELRRELDELTRMLREPIQEVADVSDAMEQVRDLDTRRRALDQLSTAWLHYAVLANHDAGTALFLKLFAAGRKRHDVLFQELICHEIERFLPDESPGPAPLDVLGRAVADVRAWLAGEGRIRNAEIVLDVASFLTVNEQPGQAAVLLRTLPEAFDDPRMTYRRHNALGNAHMRIGGQVVEAERHFQQALRSARDLPPTEQERRIAEAHKELGFYFRNLGRWNEANDEYRAARTALSIIAQGPDADDADRAEIASIQTNWAYLTALQGNYVDARNLVESAIEIRDRMKDRHGVAMSLSVAGEIYRYQGKYVRAWQSYAAAEASFEARRSWPWLGLLYQQQAICLHFASIENFRLLDDDTDPRARAKELIERSLRICRNLGVRSYPSALNRAGRILGYEDAEAGLAYLAQAIDEADRLSDGWFLSASLIEYFELSYQAWRSTRDAGLRWGIEDRIDKIEQVIEEYSFTDLPARWKLLQGHLAVEDALHVGRFDDLDDALVNYGEGFSILASGHVGSHGVTAIRDEFETFRGLYRQLPPNVQSEWLPKLQARWTQLSPERSVSLLALLEKLY